LKGAIDNAQWYGVGIITGEKFVRDPYSELMMQSISAFSLFYVENLKTLNLLESGTG
jgi:hypothetical protein